MPLHMDEFQGEEFQGYVENVPAARSYLLQRFLPNKTTKDIDFAYNVIDGKYGQAASITGFNATAPLRDKNGLAKAFGSVAKVQHGFRLDEKEILKFNRPRDNEEKSQAVDYVYDETDDLIQGVYDTEEWMRAQVLYNGALVYNDTVNDIQVNITFDIPAENKLNVTTAWSDPASKPLDDIQAGVNQFMETNQRRKPIVMHMTSVAEANLLKNTQIKNQVYGNPTDQRLLTKQDLQNVFSALGLPPYEINDDAVDLYGTGATQLLADNKVVLLGENLGNTFIGPTVEKNFESGIYVVPEIKETNPPSQSVFVGETVFPALQRPKGIVHLTV
ncbi:major capsid protein [Metabacillus litoralis]|uniref:major capsid protein n=1 Tax=Metabacillus litoralis TaxID=152268 RepID=UPI00203B6A9A|nr:major capsid protein [Metabacillus litoralis]MCM3651325.1 major capsid protein [Metabacillus litoralis]